MGEFSFDDRDDVAEDLLDLALGERESLEALDVREVLSAFLEEDDRAVESELGLEKAGLVNHVVPGVELSLGGVGLDGDGGRSDGSLHRPILPFFQVCTHPTPGRQETTDTHSWLSPRSAHQWPVLCLNAHGLDPGIRSLR